MKNIVIGKANKNPKMIDFYLECGGESYYIFTRRYRATLFSFFKNGIHINKLFDLGKAHGNKVIINTMIQLKGMLKYIEEENNLQILCKKNNIRQFKRREKLYDSDLAA